MSPTYTTARAERARAFNQATGRIKLAWFLLHVSRYLPPLVYAADREWGAKAVDNHRQLIDALHRRDVDTVVSLTGWQFSDGARRLTARLDGSEDVRSAATRGDADQHVLGTQFQRLKIAFGEFRMIFGSLHVA